LSNGNGNGKANVNDDDVNMSSMSRPLCEPLIIFKLCHGQHPRCFDWKKSSTTFCSGH